MSRPVPLRARRAAGLPQARPPRAGLPRARWVVVVLALIASVVAGVLLGRADRPVAGVGSGPRYVVGLGDSYLSGEAGRWAGNTHAWDSEDIDALGPDAYDPPAADRAVSTTSDDDEQACHRASSAEVLVSELAVNLACSGARTMTTGKDDGRFTPGLDFYDGGDGRIGQALALQRFAAAHPVGTVVVSIGGNNIGFGSLLSNCVQDFMTSSSWVKNHCHSDDEVQEHFTDDALADRVREIAGALRNVASAMSRAGYSRSEWTLVVQDYPAPLPSADRVRYDDKYHERSLVGGCGLWDADLDWAARTAVPVINRTVWRGVDTSGLDGVQRLSVDELFAGHRLCEKGVGKLFETHTASWRSPGAMQQAEWVTNVRTTTLAKTPFSAQESLHPNYWGQRVLRACLRAVVDAGHAGSCRVDHIPTDDHDDHTEPTVTLH